MSTSKNKVKNKSSIVMQAKPHYAIFTIPSIIALYALYSAINQMSFFFFFFFLLCITFNICLYFFSFKDKKLVLTPLKLYYIDKKKKSITINLSLGEIVNISYETSKFGKILGYSNIYLYVMRNNKKHYLSYRYITNGEAFIKHAFSIQEDFHIKQDPNYIRTIDKNKLKHSLTTNDGSELDKL